jgi:hypothetical protein
MNNPEAKGETLPSLPTIDPNQSAIDNLWKLQNGRERKK